MIKQDKVIIKKWMKAIFIMSTTFLIVCTNYIYVRSYFKIYDKQLRYFDHFLASIAVTELIYMLINNLNWSCLIYSLACFSWESYQWFNRGYFQIDQFIVDLIGIGVYFLIKRANKNKSTYDI